jgi:phenylacetate-CoA ligase
VKIRALAQKVATDPLASARKAASLDYWRAKLRTHQEWRDARQEAELLLPLLRGTLEGHDCREYRDRYLAQTLDYAYSNCAYYRALFDDLFGGRPQLGDFHRIPLLEKAVIRERQTELVSARLRDMSSFTMNTGGSTGEPLEFPRSTNTGFVGAVHQLFAFQQMGYAPGDRVVAVDGVSIPPGLLRRHVYWIRTGSDIPHGRMSYSSLYLNPGNMQHYVDSILRVRPAFIRGYPSAIGQIAAYLAENRIDVPFRIKGVQLTAEVAHGWQIRNIEEAMRTKVYLQYGHSEACVYAHSFGDSRELVCSPFYGLTEVLGADGNHVGSGDTGEVVVTGFHNFALPFIRYRTGDLATFSRDDRGLVVLSRLMGRTQDIVFTRQGDPVTLTALVFGQHYHAFRNIRQWQVVQDVPGEVTIRINRGAGFSRHDEEEIRGRFMTLCAMETHFDYVESMPLTQRGKLPFLIQNVRRSP